MKIWTPGGQIESVGQVTRALMVPYLVGAILMAQTIAVPACSGVAILVVIVIVLNVWISKLERNFIVSYPLGAIYTRGNPRLFFPILILFLEENRRKHTLWQLIR